MITFKFVFLLSVLHAGFPQIRSRVLELSTKDLTVVADAIGVDVVMATTQKINTAQLFDNDFGLLARIALVESNFGKNAAVLNSNPNGGIWQVTPSILNAIRAPSLQLKRDQIAMIFGSSIVNFTSNDYSVPIQSGLAARLYIHQRFGSTKVPGSLDAQAMWWATNYSTGGNATDFKNIVTTYEALTQCSVNAMDLWFLIDGSGSVGSGNFQKTLDFVALLSSEFNISSDGVRTGLSVFNNANQIISRFDQHQSKEAFNSTVQTTRYPGGGTSIGKAIEDVLKNGFLETAGVRPLSQGIRRVLIVLTDGRSSDSVSLPAENARKAGITVFGVGIANADNGQINEIANDPDSEYAYNLDNFDELREALEGRLARQACNVPAVLPDNATASAKVQPGDTYYSKVDLPNNGSIELTFVVSEGGGTVYMSTTISNPSSALNDLAVTLTLGKTDIQINGRGSLNVALNQSSVPLYVAVKVSGSTPLDLKLSVAENDQPVMKSQTFPGASCLIWGDSYVSTFDGRQYNFDGTCTYQAVGASATYSWPGFGVFIDKGYMDANGQPSMKAYIGVEKYQHHEGILVTASTDFGPVMVNGLRVNPGSYYEGVLVSGQGPYLVLRFEFGLTLRLHWKAGILVTLDKKFSGNVSGLCGYFDFDRSNDFAISVTGESAKDEVAFGNFWKYNRTTHNWFTPTKCPDRMNMPTMDACFNHRSSDFIKSNHVCGLLNHSLSRCSGSINATLHKMACVKALCKKDNFLQSLETALTGFVAECSIRTGIHFPNLRDNIGISFSCPKNSKYRESVPACQASCLDRDGSHCRKIKELAETPVLEGCVCNPGYIWSGFECVPMKECGCVSPTNRLYFKHGECQTDQNCHSKCQCRNGLWNCEKSPCYPNQYCGLRDGEWGCHYKDLCKYNNGGCSHTCVWSNGMARCDCPERHGLSKDNKTCVKLSKQSTCDSRLAQWRESYTKWRETYEDFKNGQHMSCAGSKSTWNFPDEEKIHSGCNTWWTMWFDTDNATGCGDDETLQRIQMKHPGMVCNHPLAIETKVVDAGGQCLKTLEDIPFRRKSPNAGLLCDNSDQEDGRNCPDFAVRFLCLKKN